MGLLLIWMVYVALITSVLVVYTELHILVMYP